VARLSEFSKCVLVCFVEYSSRRGFVVVLGKRVARPGERISPKRDNLMLLLFKTRSAWARGP